MASRGDSADVLRALTATVGAWGAANVVGGIALAMAGKGPGASAFGQQCAAWGAVNLAIAGVGHWRSRHSAVASPRLRRILLVNAALDVGYLAAGAVLIASASGRDDTSASARRGHGTAVIAQGAALLAIDSGFARRLATSD